MIDLDQDLDQLINQINQKLHETARSLSELSNLLNQSELQDWLASMYDQSFRVAHDDKYDSVYQKISKIDTSAYVEANKSSGDVFVCIDLAGYLLKDQHIDLPQPPLKRGASRTGWLRLNVFGRLMQRIWKLWKREK